MEFIIYEAVGQIGIITINRPKALNALNSQVLRELDKVLGQVDTDTVRVLILTGAGDKAFVQNAGNGQAGRPVAHGGLQHAVIRLFNDFRRDGKTHNESFR